VQSQFCRGASIDLDAKLSEHFDQITVGHPRFRAERRGDCSMEALTAATVSGPVAVRGRLVDFLFNAEPV
jgi:hypothetical protein